MYFKNILTKLLVAGFLVKKNNNKQTVANSYCCAAMLTCGRFCPGPAHQVGLSHCRLSRGRFALEPPYPHCVVIRTGSNLAAERGGLHRNQISAWAHQGAQLGSGGGQYEEAGVEEIYSGTELQRTSKKKLVGFTFEKSVGHQATEVTSSL